MRLKHIIKRVTALSERKHEAHGNEEFDSALQKLAVVGGFANHVSMICTGEPTSDAGELASMVHAKMCAHARSIGAIASSSMLDHSAIMALARMLVDGLTMSSYLRETVDPDLWELKTLCLQLHDTTNRIKFLRIGNDNIEDFRIERNKLISEIKNLDVFIKMRPEVQTRILRGEEIFVGGMRRAAKKCGWDEEVFTATYSYLSAHIHTSPMSFFRMRSHKIDYFNPSHAQINATNYAIYLSTACLRRATIWHLDAGDSKNSVVHEEFLASVRREDAETDIFTAR